MAPSQLQIALSSLRRLLKEEVSYYKEQEQQEARISKLEKEEGDGEDGNKEYQLKQEVSLANTTTISSSLSCGLRSVKKPQKKIMRGVIEVSASIDMRSFCPREFMLTSSYWAA